MIELEARRKDGEPFHRELKREKKKNVFTFFNGGKFQSEVRIIFL